MASSASELGADLCILGGGIAGMLLAERALARGRRVLLIERGTPMTAQQRLKQRSHDDPLPFNRSPLRSPHEPPPRGPRIRWDRDYVYWPVYNLGGCSNHLFGNMPRFHPSHFDQPAFGGGIRRQWPIAYADIEPYYLEAERRLAIAGSSKRTPFAGRFEYPLPPHRLSPTDRACVRLFGEGTVVEVPTVRPSQPVGSRPACCGSNQCHLCPIDSKGTALNTVLPAIRDRVDLRTGLLATDLHCRSGRVSGVTLRDAEGRTHRVRAREVVIACNGVDSCLLLQRSAEVPKPPSLGRYFMDHTIFQIGMYDSGIDARPGYGDSAQTGMLVPFFERVAPDMPVSLLGEIRSASLSEGSGALMRDRMLRDIFETAGADPALATKGLRARFTDVWRSSMDLWFLVEPQPMAERTVEIERIEATGQAIPKFVVGYPSYFGECISRVLSHVQRRLPRGRVEHLGSIPTSFHWLGATRLSSAPSDGCVDPNLRYHELENLYVLSTSVFPSASSANPTLTLAALALRLGDHLAERAGSGLRSSAPVSATGP
jgi:choline dehydrogenase-like flavoprotein